MQLTENEASNLKNLKNSSQCVYKDNSSQPVFCLQNEEPVEKVTNVLQNVLVQEANSTVCEQSKATEITITNAPLAQDKPKLSKVERLRALGVDLSIKPLLRPDDGTFVNLEEPQPNKGIYKHVIQFPFHVIKCILATDLKGPL